MDSGLRQTVFVDQGNGVFEPRQVETGWRLGDRVEITRGLEPGEKIVVSGNFLIDSESRMRLAAAGMFGEVTKDPVCGLNVAESKAKAAGFIGEYKNQTYYFCSSGCKQHFEHNPERYGAKPGESQEAAPDLGREAQAAKTKDPVCGLEVDETQAKAGGLTSDYDGKTHFFCSFNCNKQFDQDPEGCLPQEGKSGQTATAPSAPAITTPVAPSGPAPVMQPQAPPLPPQPQASAPVSPPQPRAAQIPPLQLPAQPAAPAPRVLPAPTPPAAPVSPEPEAHRHD